MEFGFTHLDDCSSTTTTDTDLSERRASDVFRGGIFEAWLEAERANIPKDVSPLSSPIIQVVPPIIRKYHKPPSQDRISVSSMATVVINPDEDDDDDESILMPFIGDHEFEDGEFPEHIITVENEKMIAMSNPKTLSILPTVQETLKDYEENFSHVYTLTDCSSHILIGIDTVTLERTPSHSRSPSSHAFHDDEDDPLTDTEVFTDDEILVSDRDASSVSWTEEDDVDITDTNVDDDASDIQSYLKDYLEDKEKREAETSSNLKRAPNRDLVYSTSDLSAPSLHQRLSESMNRRPQYVDYLASSPKKGLEMLQASELNTRPERPPLPHGEMATSFPDVVPHFDETPQMLPVDIYFEHKELSPRTPSDRSPSLTPMDKLLESLPPLPSTKNASMDSFHALPTMYSSHLAQLNTTPPVNSKHSSILSESSHGSDEDPQPPPSPANSITKSPSKILLCKVEPEKKSVFPVPYTAKELKEKHEEMKEAHDRSFSDVDYSDVLSDDLLLDFEAGPSHEIQSGISFLTMLVNDRQDIRITVIE